MSGGAYMLARLAERIGGAEYRNLTRVGTAVALAVGAAVRAPSSSRT